MLFIVILAAVYNKYSEQDLKLLTVQELLVMIEGCVTSGTGISLRRFIFRVDLVKVSRVRQNLVTLCATEQFCLIKLNSTVLTNHTIHFRFSYTL